MRGSTQFAWLTFGMSIKFGLMTIYTQRQTVSSGLDFSYHESDQNVLRRPNLDARGPSPKPAQIVLMLHGLALGPGPIPNKSSPIEIGIRKTKQEK